MEILIAQLAEIGFESFVETDQGTTAYIQKAVFNNDLLQEVGLLANPDFQVSYGVEEIAQQNWNQQWEQSFEPIVVADRCVVRAPFHKATAAAYEIIIEPKMSFGTGHHETTYMMLQLLLDIDCSGKTVLDMGCGTAVLAILAEKRGAKVVDAIDIDTWCVENSTENAQRNDCSTIKVFLGDAGLLNEAGKYDLILANINRNILLQDIPTYRSALKEGGQLLLSGFYLEDLEMIKGSCKDAGGEYLTHLIRNNWIAAKFVF